MKLLLLFLLVAPLLAQVPNPQVPFSGRIGPGGNFPLFNGGTIPITGDYTMKFPDMTASVIRFTGSLSAAATITAPSAQFGYEFTIQNATNQSLVFQAATPGTGVTIPSGQVASVIFDGTNYVSTGGGGGAVAPGYNVPANYPTVQGAVNAASTAGAGPVGVMPEATDRTPFTNPNGVRVTDYRQRGGIDSRFSRDVSEWGVKGDGKTATGCTTTAGSNVVNCPAANFTSGDVNKLIIVYNVGPPSGSVNPDIPVTIVSGPAGVPNTYYKAINTDASSGCDTLDTQPYMWVHTGSNGVPDYNGWTWNFYGQGCSHFPTTWSLAPVYAGPPAPSGTMTTSGGGIFAEDQPSVITAVNSATQITVADNMTVSSSNNITILYGTDDTTAWTTACNAMKDTSGLSSSAHSHGTLTFTGTSLTATGIDCSGGNMWLKGSGYLTLGESNSSILVYAGKTPGQGGGGYLMRFHGGWGNHISDLGFRGNTFAQPFLLVLAFDAASTVPTGSFGTGINTTGLYEDLSFGFMYGDVIGGVRPGAPYSSQSCIFADTNQGNVDWNAFERIYCRGALVGVDGNNSQAVGWRFDIVHSENNLIGVAVGGSPYFFEYYTEFNKVDMMLGSPVNVAWFPGPDTTFERYDGESSAQMVDVSPLYNSAGVECRHCGGTNPNYIGPKGVGIDLTHLAVGKFTWHGATPGQIWLQRSCRNQLDYDFETNSPFATTVEWANYGYGAACPNLTQSHMRYVYNGNGDGSNTMQTQIDQFPDYAPTATALTQTMGGQQVRGSIQALAATAPGDAGNPSLGNAYLTISAYGTGSTTYNYQVTCKDGFGRETGPNPNILAITNGSPLNATTNLNTISFQSHAGCATYCFYGDEGSGGIIGRLACVDQTAMPNGAFVDEGQYVPDTTTTPPKVSQSGLIDASGYSVQGQPFAGFKSAQGIGSQMLADFSPTKAALGNVPVYNGTQYIPGSVVPQSAGIVTSQGGVNSVAGYNTIGQHNLVLGNNVIYFTAFTPTETSRLIDVKQYIYTVGGGLIYAAIYDSDGYSVTDNSSGAPFSLLCYDTVGTAPVVNSWTTISSLNVANCPLLSGGHKYFLATAANTTSQGMVDNSTFDGTNYTGGINLAFPCCVFPVKNNGYPYNNGQKVSQYVDLVSTYVFGPSYSPTNLVPPTYLGAGTTGTGTHCLSDTSQWVACSGGTGTGMVYPAAGIANSNGSTWNPSYNTTTNQIPAGYISTLNQNTTGNAATATALQAAPNQCSGGQFATGITAAGNANCATPSGGGGAAPTVVPFTLSGSAGPIAGFPVTLLAAPAAGMYKIDTTLVQTGGTDCTTVGNIQGGLFYRDADSNVNWIGTMYLVGFINGNGAMVANIPSATTLSTLVNARPASLSSSQSISAAAGTPIQFQINQSTASSGCTATYATWVVRVRITGPY